MPYKTACVVKAVDSTVCKNHLISAMRYVRPIYHCILQKQLIHIRLNLIIAINKTYPFAGSMPDAFEPR